MLLEVLSGDGRFPEGRKQLLTPKKHTFHDGMGAMEMRAYFAGEIVIRAVCDGLICEKRIRAVGSEAWDGRCLRLPGPPPSVIGAPDCREQYDIAAQRPVFCSGSASGETASQIVDTRMDTAWTAVEPAWVMVDLEGNKTFHQLIVRLAAGDAADVVLSLSADGTNFVSVKDAEVTERKIEAAIEGSWRYIRIEAKRAGTAIQAVHCMAK